MQSWTKIFNSALLILGTTLGAGMLGFPITSGLGGLLPALGLFISFFAIMILSALMILDVNLAIPGKSHMIKMVEHSLGTKAKWWCSVCYLILLYCLTAAYLLGLAPLCKSAMMELIPPLALPEVFFSLLLSLLFSILLYGGIHSINKINYFLNAGLMLGYFALIIFLPPYVQWENLLHFDMPAALYSIPVIATSFGYQVLIPSIADYLNHDRKSIIMSILIGSSSSLMIYLLWETLLLGVLPIDTIAATFAQKALVTVPLKTIIKQPLLEFTSVLFSFFAIITSLIGVSLSLSDFILEGLPTTLALTKRKKLALGLTFLPPLLFSFFFPRGFYLALEYVGTLALVILLVIPISMILKLPPTPWYASPRVRQTLIGLLFATFFLIVFDLGIAHGFLEFLIEKYNV